MRLDSPQVTAERLFIIALRAVLPIRKYLLRKSLVVGKISAEPLVGLVVSLPEPKDGLVVRPDIPLNGLPVLGDQHEVTRALAAPEEGVDVADLSEVTATWILRQNIAISLST